jgi:hypothetical protein
MPLPEPLPGMPAPPVAPPLVPPPPGRLPDPELPLPSEPLLLPDPLLEPGSPPLEPLCPPGNPALPLLLPLLPPEEGGLLEGADPGIGDELPGRLPGMPDGGGLWLLLLLQPATPSTASTAENVATTRQRDLRRPAGSAIACLSVVVCIIVCDSWRRPRRIVLPGT